MCFITILLFITITFGTGISGFGGGMRSTECHSSCYFTADGAHESRGPRARAQ